MGRIILVLGGGAPNLTLMSGALAALHDQGCEYDVISMAGGGAVVGLCYLAPKNMTPAEALRNTINFGVSDAIYSVFPINYKIFSKGGPSAAAFREVWDHIPPVWRAEHQYGMSPWEKLQSDMLLFAGAMAAPTDVNYFSQAICAHFPFIEQLVDFDRLRGSPGPRLLLNAWSMDTSEIVEFERPCLDVHHFRAALSFPFLYAPYEIDGCLYSEGAAFSCLNLINLAHNTLGCKTVTRVQRSEDPDKFILFDVLRTDLIHPPINLWDAYTQSIIIPLISDAAKELSIFSTWLETGVINAPPSFAADVKLTRKIEATNHKVNLRSLQVRSDFISKEVRESISDELKKYILRESGERHLLDELSAKISKIFRLDDISSLPIDYRAVPNAEMYTVGFDVPVDQWPYMLDWSRSNLERLFDIGYEAGLCFYEQWSSQIWT
jgi:NTE family protein